MSKMAKPGLVVGVDFGMTHTGVAYGFSDSRGSLEPRLLQSGWPGRENAQVFKVPTIVVYKNKKMSLSSKLTSYGFLSEQHDERYSPRRIAHSKFKLCLDEDLIPPHLSHKEVQRWYQDYLKEIYSHVEEQLKSTYPKKWKGKVEFVFSFPTQFSDEARQHFERVIKAAGFGSCEGHQAFVTLRESQAAAICASREKSEELEVGQLMMVLDAGGGTTDIGILEVVANSDDQSQLKEVNKEFGGSIGSTKIDDGFRSYLEAVLIKINNDNPDTFRVPQTTAEKVTNSGEFQTYKCQLGTRAMNGLKVLPITIPGLPEGYENLALEIQGGKISYPKMKLEKLFNEQLTKLFEKLDDQLTRFAKKRPGQRISYLILSGGLGSSAYLKDAIEKRYCENGTHASFLTKKMEILKASHPQEVVAKGLVINRLQKMKIGTSVLTSRISVNSVGLVTDVLYNPAKHINAKVHKALNGQKYADNAINWLIREGDPLNEGEAKTQVVTNLFEKGSSRNWKSKYYISTAERNALPDFLPSNNEILQEIDINMSQVPLDSPYITKSRDVHLTGISTYYSAKYTVKVIVEPGNVEFEIWFGGKRYSRDSLDNVVKWTLRKVKARDSTSF
jgi:hypothetical protein